MKRVEGIVCKRAWLISGLLSFLLLVGLSSGSHLQDVEGDYVGDGIADDTGQNYAEVFSAGDSNSGIVYINWQEPQSTNDFPRATWFLGAYRFDDGSLVVELSAEGGSASGGEHGSSLTNNLRYALNYSAGADSALYLRLLDTNGLVLAESDNLLTSSNVAHYVFPPLADPPPADLMANSGIPATNTVLLVNVPTAEYPEAAVIQIVGRHIHVHEALLYIDEDGDFLTAEVERRNEASDYAYDGNGSISNYYDWVNGNGAGGSTNNTDGSGGSGGDENQGRGNNRGILYVDQVVGNDNFTGYAPTVAGRNGPKKTVHGGLTALEQNGAHTLIINSGDYGEDLDLREKGGVKIVIEGNVRL